MKNLILVLVVLCNYAYAQAPKELHAILEVPGADSGAMLGMYVKGVGDLNKDGYADVAVSAPGKLQTYIYYGGKTMSKTPSLTLQGGGTIVAGDFNGDGWIDLAIEKYSRDTVLVYFGNAKGMDTIPDLILTQPSDYFGHVLVAGDINGDGFTDIIIATWDQNMDSTLYLKGRIFIYAGATQMKKTPVAVFIGDTTKAGLGADLAIGDINHDGKMDIIALGVNQESPSIHYSYISIFLGDSLFHMKRDYYIDSRNVPGGFKDHVTCFDADGDGIDDILVNKIYIFKGGAHLDTLPTYYVGPPNNDSPNFGDYPWVTGGGDFNGDGIKDILLSSTQGVFGVVPGVYLMLDGRNHPGQYVAYRVFSNYWTEALDGRPENAGDVNGDGVDDIIIGGPDAFLHNEGIFGIYSGEASLKTSVKKEPVSKPESFELKQNYPNPFNPSTIISYELLENSFVTLKIFNTFGEVVATLVHEKQTKGNHIVRWNGTNNTGRKVASGSYYYQLSIPGGSSAKKAIYLK